MNVKSRGFEIVDVSASVSAITSDGQQVSIAAGDIPADDIPALIEALKEAHRLITGAVSTAREAVELKDVDGDIWRRVAKNLYATRFVVDPKSREWIQEAYGPVEEIYAEEVFE